MKKLPFSYWHTFYWAAILFLLSACTTLNGTYCTPTDLAVKCMTFDRKKHILYHEFGNCIGHELKRGKYKQVGDLLIVDLIPYSTGKEGSATANYENQGESGKTQVVVKISVKDSIEKEPISGAYIKILKPNGNVRFTASTDIEGKAEINLDPLYFPLKVEIKYLGMYDGRIELPIGKNMELDFLLVNSASSGKSIEVGKKYYKIKKLNRSQFICKEIEKPTDEGFTDEELQERFYLFFKKKNPRKLN